MTDIDYLKLAVAQAEQSFEQGGFPAGSIIVINNSILSRGVSNGFLLHDPTSHSDIAAIRIACKESETPSLKEATLYSSIQPCTMCFQAANWAGISRIVYGCKKTEEFVKKGYYEGSTKLETINQENTRTMELIYLPDFEEQVLTLIKEWEELATNED